MQRVLALFHMPHPFFVCVCVCALQESDVSGPLFILAYLGASLLVRNVHLMLRPMRYPCKKSLASVAIVLGLVPLSNPFITPA